MNPKIILTDLDGPLADFEGEFLRRWRERYPDEFFIPFEERRSFFFNDDRMRMTFFLPCLGDADKLCSLV